jgi:hypothetical protein
MWLRELDGPGLRLGVTRVGAPLLLVLVLTLSAMGYYFWRTTGSPWRTPYVLNEHTYDPVPSFPWQSLRPVPDYHHDVMRAFYLGDFILGRYRSSRTMAGLVEMKLSGLLGLWRFFLGPVLTLPLLLAVATMPYGYSWKDLSKDTRFLLLVCGAVTAATTLPIWSFPHYAAPITCAIYALVLQAMRKIHSWQSRNNSAGLFVARAVPSVCVLLLALRAGAGPLRLALLEVVPNWCSPHLANLERARMLRRLEQYPGRNLVIVHYSPHHNTHNEWVYNGADIDGAEVVWARDMGSTRNEELVRYFKDRRVWLVNADDHPAELAPYLVSAVGGQPEKIGKATTEAQRHGDKKAESRRQKAESDRQAADS